MKKFLTLLTVAVALTAHSVTLLPLLYLNTGTNVGDPNAERMDYYAWVKLNSSIRAAETNFVNLNAAISNPVPTGIVKTSTTVYELSTNYTFTAGSNYLGSFTNIYSFYAVAAIGVTNQPLTNNMSLDGGATWQPFYVTNPFTSSLITNIATNNYISSYLVSTNLGTNTILISMMTTNSFTVTNYGTNFTPTPVKISTLCANTCTGIVQIATLNDFSAKGRANTFVGQTVDFTGATVLGLPSSAGITNFVFTVTNTASTNPPSCTVIGVTNNVAYCLQIIPVGTPGAAGTNTVTVQNFSNTLMTATYSVAYQTNYARWNVGSNFLARVQGVTRIFANAGYDNANPPNPYGFTLTGSYSGTNGYFTITNTFDAPFFTSNTISLWLNATSVPAGNPGSVTITTCDHFELINRINDTHGEIVRVDNPVNGRDAANKQYVDNAVANALNNTWALTLDTNAVTHYKYSYLGSTVLDLVGQQISFPFDFAGRDITGTNMLLMLNLTNLSTGWTLQCSTNLAIGAAGFTVTTNYLATTNAGELNLTIPANLPQMFFIAIKNNGTAIMVSSTIDVSHSTNSTFGLGAGLMAITSSSGTNWLNISAGVNRWGRIAIPTNSW